MVSIHLIRDLGPFIPFKDRLCLNGNSTDVLTNVTRRSNIVKLKFKKSITGLTSI